MAGHLNRGQNTGDSECDTNQFIRFVIAFLFVLLVGLLFEAIVWSQKTPEQRQQEIERMRQDTERRKAREPFDYHPGFHYFGSNVLFF
jgi:hypothetical protein